MKNLLLILFCALTLSVQAQMKELTLEDAVIKGRGALGPARLDQLGWIPGTSKYCYVANKKLVIADATNFSAKKDSLEVLSNVKKVGANNFPQMNWINSNSFYFQHADAVYTYNITTNTASLSRSLDTAAGNIENVDIEKNSLNVAYTVNNDLHINANGTNKKIAASEKDGIVYGKSVHREEYGIVKGTFWSPKGNKLAYYRMDESMVSQYPIYQLDEKPAGAKMIRYPMAGGTSHHVDVMVYDVATDKSIKLSVSGPPDQYLTNIAWSPDEKFVYIAVLNRATDHMWMNQYDAATGDYVKTLFEETSTKYVEPLHPLMFTPDGKYMLWQSQRDGFNSFYKYDLEGRMLKKIAAGPITIDFNGFDQEGKNIFLTVVDPNSIVRYGIKASLADGSYESLSTGSENRIPVVSSKGDYAINIVSAWDLPRRFDLINVKKKSVAGTILNAPNPLTDYKIGKVSIEKVKAGDGTALFSRVVYPYDFNPSKKYPMVVYLYNGPHVQLVTNTWLAGADLWMFYLANKGYIVYTIDGRGSDNRGFAFESCIHRQLGNYEMRDQMEGINFMKKQPYIDSTRIGVDGWSYGGFMTISLLTRQPGVFKAAVAGGPVIDWSYYEVMYTERYMDTPQENPEGYKNNSLFNYVDNMKGKLLIIHGTSDDVVVWQHSLLYLKKCIEKGKQVDYFVYPGHQHNVFGPDRVHLMRKITDYFINNL